MTTIVGIPPTVGLVASGSSIDSVPLLVGGTIDLTGIVGTILDMAYSMPRDTIITSLVACFSNVVSLIFGTVTVTAQIYQSIPPTNIFTPTGVLVNLTPTLSGSPLLGVILTGSASPLSFAVTAQTRLLLVFAITATSPTQATVTGYASGGIALS